MRKNLSHVVEPSHYDLYLSVNEDGFEGKVTVQAVAQVAVSEIQMNSSDLLLNSIRVNEKEAESRDDGDGFFTIKTAEPVSGELTIEIIYSGSFSDKLEGFYKSMSRDSPVYSTHFEAADARKAFPCFDQPDMKATFSISIKAPEGYIALSNNRLIKQEGQLFTFEKTPRMSTYIVAWVVGKLDYIEADTLDFKNSRETDGAPPAKKSRTRGIPIRVYTHPEEKEWGRFSLDVAVRCLSFFEDYFEVDYPLPKLDMVAIPSFAMGAMENWGLVTYRNTSLLFDEKSTAMRSKKNIANTVCHELAHMWFGNLVTMEWWNDLWLNEGFATWAASLAIAHSQQDILPWEVWTSFINDDIESGMGKDSLESTHKIAVEVNNPVEIDQIFDEISYSKGSSIIKMVENWLGAETFRKGLVRYLKEYKFKNTVTKNLWDALSAEVKSNKSGVKGDENNNNGENGNTDSKNTADKIIDTENNISDKSTNNENNTTDKNTDHKTNTNIGDNFDVDKVIDPWVSRDGFPFITVEEEGDSLVLTQRRFTLGYEKEDEPWPIPLKIRWIPENKVNTFIMNKKTMRIKKESKLYKINDKVSGFYRVLYPQQIFSELVRENIGTENLLNLFADAFALGKGLYAPLPVKYTAEMRNQDNYEVLSVVLGSLINLKSVFYGDDSRVKYFTDKVNEIIGGRVGSIDLSNPGKSINEISTNSLLISMGVSVGNKEVIQKLKKMDVSNIHAEFLRSYYIANIDDKFNETYKTYIESNIPSEKVNALFALGKTESFENLKFLFQNIKSIKPHEAIYLFASLGGNIKLRHQIMELFVGNFDLMCEHIKEGNIMRHVIEYIFLHVLSGEYKNNAVNFLESISKREELTSAIRTCNDSITLNSKLRDSYVGRSFD